MIGDQLIAAMGTKVLYEILNLEKKGESSAEEIKKAYRKAALCHHPDKGGDAEKFKAVSVAHSILGDQEKKGVYDETGDVDEAEEGDINEKNFSEWDIEVGDKIAQAVLTPVMAGKFVNLQRVLNVDDKDRGDNGFGSTGN